MIAIDWREVFRFGSSEREVWCRPENADMWRDALDEADLAYGYEVTLKVTEDVPQGQSFIVDPATHRRIPL